MPLLPIDDVKKKKIILVYFCEMFIDVWFAGYLQPEVMEKFPFWNLMSFMTYCICLIGVWFLGFLQPDVYYGVWGILMPELELSGLMKHDLFDGL